MYLTMYLFKKSYLMILSDWGQETERPQIMSEEHKMTKQDKLALTITLAIIFFGVFGLAFVGLIVNLSR